ncbi:MAG: hypothetical protein Q8N51_11440, partial [Gammaproteobacteria bacterium]|nr:hypothetical protein [Gammaproteobacteria bacterium]
MISRGSFQRAQQFARECGQMPQIRHVGSRPQTPLATAFQTATQAQQSPLENQLLASLPAADLVRLRPLMKSVCLPRGTLVHGPGALEDQVCFPTAGIFVDR